jgi:lipopolysaccharide/colanic/teichoic acid biosynthesis glycosyltransferase
LQKHQKWIFTTNDTKMAPPLTRIHRNVIAPAPATSVAMGSRWRLARRIRLQLGGGIALCVLLPAIVRWLAMDNELVSFFASSLGNAFVGTMVALVVGYVLLRQFITYPGVKATNYILPVFAATYAAAAVTFFFARIEYSRWQFAASFILAIAWFYLIYALMRQYGQPRLALVPGGNDRKVTRLAGAEWVRLDGPPISCTTFDAFVADLRANLSPEWERFIAHMVLNGIAVYDVKQVAESLTGRVEIEHLSENNFGSVLPSLSYLRLKRFLDFGVAVLAIPVFVPVIVVAALCIRLESSGPVLFKQRRTGYRGREFTCYKLRSMLLGEEGKKFTTENDQRVTRVGRFIRKYHIDEFPQIFNVLKGDMSLIGPRPEAVELAEWYEKEVPYYAYRHAVRPGITGWAQVQQGNVAEVEAATKKLHYDFYYIKNFSPWLDLLIVAKTICSVLVGFERTATVAVTREE